MDRDLQKRSSQGRRQGGAWPLNPHACPPPPPNQQAYSLEDSAYVLDFKLWPPKSTALARALGPCFPISVRPAASTVFPNLALRAKSLPTTALNGKLTVHSHKSNLHHTWDITSKRVTNDGAQRLSKTAPKKRRSLATGQCLTTLCLI